MEPSATPRVKICCIASVREAQMAIEAGASAIGLVSAMPSGPGVIPEERIARIARTIPPGVATFLLTSRQDAASIVEQHRRCRTQTVQLVDAVADGVYDALRQALPGVTLVQVVHVTGAESIAEAIRVSGSVDALLLDSGNPLLPVKELGGTGRIHDWTLSCRIREAVGVPVFLAGGLHAGNVAGAIAAVRPFGVDVCSGVRSSGELDPARLSAFFASVHSTIASREQ